jgi:hypothetical protein
MDPQPSDVSRKEQGLLLATLLLIFVGVAVESSFWRPGFSAYDEESQLDFIQAWFNGQSLGWRPGFGGLHRALVLAACSLFGHNPASVRLPALLGVGAEIILLFIWLKPRLGERAALWACLADLLCTATFARARSMISPSILPALFLAHAVLLTRLRRPWQHLLWGFSAALCLADYEGWTVALAWLGPAWIWSHGRGQNGWAPWAGVLLGAAGGAVAAGLLHMDWRAYIMIRHGVSSPNVGAFHQVLENLRSLLGGGYRLTISGASGQPWPEWWIWPLLPFGLGAWKRWPGLAGLALAGSVPLAMGLTSTEPHRLSLLLLALAAAAGWGAAMIWRRNALRPWLLLLLLVGGASESYAWVNREPVSMSYTYGRSWNLIAAARWMKAHEGAEGWRVIDGVGPFDDGSFRFLAAEEGLKPGTKPVVLVHHDYRPGLRGLRGRQLVFQVNSDTRSVVLYFPAPAEVARFEHIQAAMRPLRRRWLTAWSSTIQTEALAQLKRRDITDPWIRTCLWDSWYFASGHLNDVDPKTMLAAAREPLVSGWIFDSAAYSLSGTLPRISEAFSKRALSADPTRIDLPQRNSRL